MGASSIAIAFVAGLAAILLIKPISADYHILTARSPNVHLDGSEDFFQPHFRYRRSLTDADDLMMDFIQEDKKNGSGTDINNGVEITTKIQNFQFYVKNTDTKTSARATLSELMPNDAVLMDFVIHNQGESYRYNGKGIKTLEKASEEFENSVNNGLSAVMVGDVQISSDRCSDCRSDSLEGEAVAAVINIAPGDVLSVTLSYLVPLTRAALQESKELYRTDVTIDLGESATSFKGILMSPNYPDEYPNNADLTWLVQAPTKTMAVTANLLSFDSESCCDHLYIYDGSTDTSPMLDVVSGDSYSTAPIVTSGSSMLVKFQSDFAYNGGGFALEFFPTVNQVVSPSSNKSHINESLVLTESEGIIQTPGYPQSCPSFSTIVWSIRLDVGYTINLIIRDIDVMPEDNLVIRNDLDGNIISTLSNDISVPFSTNVASNQISLIFTSQQSFYPRRGIYIQYASRGGNQQSVITLGEDDYEWRTLYSPNYPGSYENNEYMVWIITTSPTDLIRLEIVSLYLESGYDWLLLYDSNNTASNKTLMASLSGLGGSDIEYITTGDAATVVFKSDGSVTDRGFEINYKSYKIIENCSYTLQSIELPEGMLRNWMWPNYEYFYDDCQWLISVTPGKVVEVFLGQFFSSYSDLTFYDGDTKYDTVLWTTYSNSEYFRDAIAFQSSSNTVLVRLEPRYSGSTKYSFRFQEADHQLMHNCSSESFLSASPGQITSPMYPRYAQSHTNCSWVIQAPKDDIIVLTIDDYASGYYDSIRFYDVDSENSSMVACAQYYGHYCYEGQVISSNSSTMLISSSVSSAYSYFKFSYTFLSSQSMIGGFGDYSGIVVSPSFPSLYPNNYYHVYYVSVAAGGINIHFNQFDTESCCDIVNIYDGPSTSSLLIAKLSGSRNGYSVQANSSYITMEFSTDGSFTSTGFQMLYSASGNWYQQPAENTPYSYISLDSRHEDHYLASPGATGQYPNNADLYWFTSCSSGSNRVYYRFYRIDINSWDFLFIYEGFGVDDNKKVLSYSDYNYYHGVRSKTVYDAYSTLWFHSDAQFSGLGFYAEFYCN